MDSEFNYVQKEKQVLSPETIQNLQILVMDNIELNEFLQNEYLENPMLDCTQPQELTIDLAQFDKEYKKHLTSIDYRQNTYAVEKQNQIKHYLLSQLNQQKYNKKEWNLFCFLIDCLDNKGFFTVPIEEVSKLTKMPQKVIEACLEDLRILEPIGIFAQDLEHCLLRQLEVLGIGNKDLEKIILFHLSDIAKGKISTISRAQNLSTAQVRKYISIISKLNPNILVKFELEKQKYIIPDVICSYKEKKWDIVFNNEWIGHYKLNEYYRNMMDTIQDEELYEYFKEKLERVRFIMDSIEQRKTILLKISKIILEKQKEYFLKKSFLKPMTLLELAQEMQMDFSVISKIIERKYLQCPKGTLLMESFFSAEQEKIKTI